MAKFIVDEEVAMATIEKWGSGELTKALMRDIFSKSEKMIYCKECDMAGPCLTPMLQKSFVNCEFYRTYMGRDHFCSHGEERKNYATKSCI